MSTRPLLNSVRYKQKTSKLTLGDGINTYNSPFELKETQGTYSRNISSRMYPAMRVRSGRQNYATALTTPNALGQRNNQYLHVVDGTTWKYWNGTAYVNVATGLTNAKGEFEEFATGTTRYLIYSNETERKAWDGSTITDLSNAPSSKIFTTHKGRIYWARDNDIVYSALNLINDYTTGSGGGTIDVTRSKGVLTGLYQYSDKVIVFTAYGMHLLYGTDSTTFELVDIEGDVGCISNRSLTACGKRLYFVAYDGIYEYDGSSVIKISEPYYGNGVKGGVTSYINNINFTYKTKIVGGSYGDIIYFSIPYGSSATENNLLLIFDTNKRIWNIETGGFVNFVTIDNVLYGVDSDGTLWDMVNGDDDEGTDITWSFITKPFTANGISNKTSLHSMWITCDLPTGSTLTVSYSTTVDNDDFTSLTSFTADSDEQNTRVLVPVGTLQNIDWYRLKFNGTGQCTIHYIDIISRVKG